MSSGVNKKLVLILNKIGGYYMYIFLREYCGLEFLYFITELIFATPHGELIFRILSNIAIDFRLHALFSVT